MEIKYLGTGGAEGFPSIFCQCEACRKVRKLLGKNVKTRSCTLVDRVMIDLSPDIFSQCIWCGVDLSEINNVVFTHSHSDHLNTTEICFRLREMASVIQKKDKKVMNFYGNQAVYDAIMDMVAKDPHVDMARMAFHPIKKFTPFQVEGLIFTPLKACHKLDEEALIFAINDGRSTILYANDTGTLPEETWKFIEQQKIKFDIVSMDTCRGTLEGDTHMGIRENLKMREKLLERNAVKEDTVFYLNHFSHMCGLTPQEYEHLVSQYGFQLTFDGLSITV